MNGYVLFDRLFPLDFFLFTAENFQLISKFFTLKSDFLSVALLFL